MRKKADLTIFSKHWVLKLLSLIIGASLWYIVAGEDQFDTTVTVPLELHNLPADLVIANQYKREIEASIRGPRRLIREMRQQNITRPVDLAKAEPGALVIKNELDSIAFPRGITVQRLQPTSTTLLVDKLMQKDFVITPQTKGKPAPGYALDKVSLDPERLTLTGPQSILSKEPSLRTSVIGLDGLERSTSLQVHLQLSDPLFKLIGETVIMANIAIRETVAKKTVRNIPVNVRDAGETIAIEPALVSIEAEIPENVLRETPEPVMLFRAAISGKVTAETEEIGVMVNALTLPGHDPINIVKVIPDKVRIIRQRPAGETAPPAGR